MIWVIAGTKNARDLISALLERNYSVLATTSTDYGTGLLDKHKNLNIHTGPCDADQMSALSAGYPVKLIIDSSHPYAVEVSKNAMSVSLSRHIPYIRHERRSIEFSGTRKCGTYAEAAEHIKERSGNILLTIGSKNLASFSRIDRSRLYARVPAFKASIESCVKAGVSPDRIIAMGFNLSKDFNKALYKELDIKYLVTKDSGEEGGLREKIGAALESDVKVIVIERPHITYPEIYFDIDDILKRASEILNG